MRVVIHQVRTADKKADPIAELVDRLLRAAKDFKARVVRDAQWEESKHPRAPDGRFGNKAGVHGKADAAGPQEGKSKQRMYDLLKSGKAFSKAELAELLGIPETRVSSFLSFFKNPKYAGAGREALNIQKTPDGKYQVLDGAGKPPGGAETPKPTPAPTPEPKPAPAPPSPPPEGDAKYTKYEQAVVTHTGKLAELQKKADKLEVGSDKVDLALRRYGAAIRELKLNTADEKRSPGSFDLETDLKDADNALDKVNVAFAHHQQDQEAQARKALAPKLTGHAKVAANAKKWTPATSSATVGTKLEALGLADKADFKDIDLEQANAFAGSLANHLAEFPAMRKLMNFYGSHKAFHEAKKQEVREQTLERFKKLSMLNPEVRAEDAAKEYDKRAWKPGNSWAASHHGYGGKLAAAVTINEKYSKGAALAGLEASLKRCVDTGFHPPGCDTVKSIADHELGHKLDELLGISKGKTAHQLRELQTAASGGTAVSRYAATNAQEFIAEAWSESINNPNPRPTAVKVAALIRSEYARQYPSSK